jgi:hypothetical protein
MAQKPPPKILKQNSIYDIQGSHGSKYRDESLLKYSAGVDRHFRGMYCPYNQGDEKAVHTSETSVYPETTRHHIPQGSHLQNSIHSQVGGGRQVHSL